MKKYIWGLLLIAGFIVAYQFLANTKTEREDVTQNNGQSFSSSFAFTSSSSNSSKSSSQTADTVSAAIDSESELSQHDIETWTAWAEKRGYEIGTGLIADYESMSDETLTTLANQHDPKAHMLLAKKLLNKPGKLSQQTFDTAAKHFYDASLLGYTASLYELSELMERRSIYEFKQRRTLLIEAYKFAYVGSKRGDPNSDFYIEALQQANHLSNTENQKALDEAEKTYTEMSQYREETGLPSFENDIPEDVQIIFKKMRDHIARTIKAN